MNGRGMRGRCYRSNSGPIGVHLEWENQPIVGARKRHNARARAWRWIFAGLFAFWCFVALAVANVVQG